MQLVDQIRKGDHQAFEQLFFDYFFSLCSYAFQITQSNDRAKDIVQEVFYKIWKHRHKWNIHTSLKAYLFRVVRNEALNQINKIKQQEQVKEEVSAEGQLPYPQERRQKTESEKKKIRAIWEIAQQMSQRRRSVFVLHRKHGLSYKEIAKVLDISRKTVENHMGLALEEIRKKLDC